MSRDLFNTDSVFTTHALCRTECYMAIISFQMVQKPNNGVVTVHYNANARVRKYSVPTRLLTLGIVCS